MKCDHFNKAKTLQESVESYKQRFGYYEKPIRNKNGKMQRNANKSNENLMKANANSDLIEFARLASSSESVITIQFIVMNLERRLRILFFLITMSGNAERYYSASSKGTTTGLKNP